MIKVLKDIFSNWKYTATFVALFILFIYLVVLYFNYPTLADFATRLGFFPAVSLSLTLLVTFYAAFSWLSALNTVLISFMISLQIVLLDYSIRQQQKIKKQRFWGVLGAALGVLGAGCSVCGTIIVAPLLAALGLTLPLGGAEFGVAAVVILAIANYILIRKLQNPFICH